MKKVCVLTGTRAEFGLMSNLMKKIKDDNDLQLQIVATGMHLSPEFGLTYKEIEEAGFKIDEKLEILLSSDTPVGLSKTMGLAMISFSESLERLKPDMIVVLGDRYEMLPVVSCACIANIPVAHLHGGEKTEGAIDDSIRHAMTKMSYLHFTSTDEYRNRVIQLGEHPDRVFKVGALGIENIKNMKLLSKIKLEESIEFSLGDKFILCTFHPVTLEKNTAGTQFQNLLNAFDKYPEYKVIFTKANSDTNGRIINQMIDEVVAKNKNRYVAFTSMGILRYLSAMKYCKAVVGNSSSGLIEAPSFNVPTVNIGDRQKGRIRGGTIIDCEPDEMNINQAISKAVSETFFDSIQGEVNPYGDGITTRKIFSVIKEFFQANDFDAKKSFYDLDSIN